MSVDVGSSSAKSEPNVVPLCDILLVLLIIFMVILPAAQKGIDIQLPETQQATPGDEPQAQNRSIVLTLEKDKTLKLNREPITMDLLPGRLRDLFQQRSEKTIFIQADKTVLYKDVLQLIDVAKGAGIEVLGVMTQAYESEG